jgi:DNA polymerase II small subunit
LIERIVSYLGDHGCVVDPEAVAYLARKPDPEEAMRLLLSQGKELPFHLTLDAVLELEPATTREEPALGIDPRLLMPQPPTIGTTPMPPLPTTGAFAPRKVIDAADYDAEVVLIKDSTGSARSHGEIQDFVTYFNQRFDTVTKLLKRRREVSNAVPIKQAHLHSQEVQLIGLVNETSSSKNGHLFLDLEDATGTASVLIPSNQPALLSEGRTLMPDEIIGLVATPSKDGKLLVAKQIVRPDLPLHKPKKTIEAPVAAAFLSDIHVGSKTFLPKPFQRMIKWLHGEEGNTRERAAAKRIKYLVLSGDVVDGVGIYPGQEESLDLNQIMDQYKELARLLEQMPQRVHLVIQPGNHDAVRPTEPQPAFGAEIKSLFSGVDATFVSNPSTFSLHGLEVLSYHGFSMVDFATRVPGLAMDKPLDIMRQMLRARHIAPTYGGATPLSPEQQDYLVIDTIPDLFVTGHVHVSGLDQYRGVSLVNAGTWQDQTDYQKTHNLVPTPARMPIVDLPTLTGTQVDFLAS